MRRRLVALVQQSVECLARLDVATGDGMQVLGERGVFGVPSYLVDGELYWGAERIPRVIEAARG